jgi:hypothetical protein
MAATIGRLQLGANQQGARGGTRRSRAALRVKAVLTAPQTEQQHASEIGSLRKAALITAVKTP